MVRALARRGAPVGRESHQITIEATPAIGADAGERVPAPLNSPCCLAPLPGPTTGALTSLAAFVAAEATEWTVSYASRAW